MQNMNRMPAQEFLENEEASIKIHVERRLDARVLWRGRSLASFSDDMLLESFAFNKVDQGCENTSVAWADRYGGGGISSNGGSGRAASINGGYIKGIGRTPLLGGLEAGWQATGFCFLDEAARECIFSNIFSFELPHGAVDILSVIDLGPTPDLGFSVPKEQLTRRVLLVRENVIRPAHFERASAFLTATPFSGEADVNRVDRNFSWFQQNTALAFSQRYVEFWNRWSEQLACQFVHRISQTTPTTSNIALDGRLLDFGAARSLPDWSAYSPGPHRAPSGSELTQLELLLQKAVVDVIPRIEPASDPLVTAASIIESVRQRAARAVVGELLSLIGFRRSTIALYLNNTAAFTRAKKAVANFIHISQKRYSTSVSFENSPKWDLLGVWDDSPPTHLQLLRLIADEIRKTVQSEPVKQRFIFRSRPRPDLDHFRLGEIIKTDLYGNFGDNSETNAIFSQFVNRTIASNRRISHHEPISLIPAGFAVSNVTSMAVFKDDLGTLSCFNEYEKDLDRSYVGTITKIGRSSITIDNSTEIDCEIYLDS